MNSPKGNRLGKKFQRRTAIITALCYATFLGAVEDRMKQGPDSLNGLHLPHQSSTVCRPFAPHIDVLSATEIHVSWLPVTPNNGIEVGRYELYQGDELEYSGHDLEHIAKRLKPNTAYDFKLRACGSLPGTCSEFSIARYAITDAKPRYGDGSALASSYLGKRLIFLNVLPGLTFAFLVIGLCIGIIYLYRYLCSYFSWLPEIDIIAIESLVFRFNPAQTTTSNYTEITKSNEKSKKRSSSCHLTLSRSDDDDDDDDEKDNEKMIKNKNIHFEDLEAGKNLSVPGTDSSSLECDDDTSDNKQDSEEDTVKAIKDSAVTKQEEKQRPSPSMGRRKRTRSVRKHKTTDCESAFVGSDEYCVDDMVLSGLMPRNRVANAGVDTTTECVVLVDNSNIFIGARETACSGNPKLRPKHVKMRLHGLVGVLERGRNITRAFAACSAPPASDHVWEIYRRLGYTVDLEDRRGKDEQRVDELLHLEIYKALVDLTPRTLVLATGDGHKGKSKSGSSFISCASAAIDHGWQVEVHSWQHCLSSEWLKVAKKYEDKLKICYLDEHLHNIVHVDR